MFLDILVEQLTLTLVRVLPILSLMEIWIFFLRRPMPYTASNLLHGRGFGNANLITRAKIRSNRYCGPGVIVRHTNSIGIASTDILHCCTYYEDVSRDQFVEKSSPRKKVRLMCRYFFQTQLLSRSIRHAAKKFNYHLRRKY